MRPVLTFLCIALGLACLASAALRDRYTENFCEDKLQCANDSSGMFPSKLITNDPTYPSFQQGISRAKNLNR